MRKLFTMVLGLIVLSAAMTTTAAASGAAPWADTLYVRGGFNGWGIVDPMTYNTGDATYTAVVAIDVGDWEFKIANESWDNPDFGPTGEAVVTLGAPIDIGTAIGANFQLSILDPGNYLFTMSDIASTLDAATLTVSRVVPVPAAGLLLVSALGGLGLLRRRR